MARIAFDIDEKTKQEIRIRLVKENKTLSEVMRALCLYYKNFGLPVMMLPIKEMKRSSIA